MASRVCESQQQRKALEIPRDSRALVEQACGGQSLNTLAASLGGDWPAHLSEARGKGFALALEASCRVIDWQAPWRDAVPGELTPDAKTRLGLNGVDIDLSSHPLSALGLTVGEVSVPSWMLPAGALAWGAKPPPAHDVRQAAEGFVFSVAGQAFRYDRHGLAGVPS